MIAPTHGFWPAYVVIVQQVIFSNAHFEDQPYMSSADPDREQGDVFLPKFDEKGLLTAVAVDSASREVLMVAFMDAEALAKTRETGLAHFHSRSRGRLWMKGETSGHVLKVDEILVDCDQDCLVLNVTPNGPACHTGATACFYRKLDGDRLARR
jgi:phosphoribosyl-AMP cyclohydrolase